MKKLTLSVSAHGTGATLMGLGTPAATAAPSAQRVPTVSSYGYPGEILSCRAHPSNFYCAR